jgi:hypothetical protein
MWNQSAPTAAGWNAPNLITGTAATRTDHAKWLVCGDCNRRLLDTDFKAAARSAFESYQQALRPVMGNRQIPLY